jgi:hypothetical protein
MSNKIDELVSSTSDENQTIIRILDSIYTRTIQEKGKNFNLFKQISTLNTAFNTEISNANKINSYYAIIKMANDEIINELYDVYSSKNDELNQVSKGFTEDILTNNRKTYYETEALYGLQNWNTFFWYLYYICFILFLLGIILAPNSVPRYISIIIAGFILIYPYVIEIIIYKAKEYFNMFYKIYPKNVYNNL